MANSNDDAPRISAALSSAANSNQPQAVLLAPGVYRVRTPIVMAASNVVLRGSGNAADANLSSVISLQGTLPFSAVTVVGSGNAHVISDTINLAPVDVPVGATTLQLATRSGLSIGQLIWVERPQTAAWFAALNMLDIWPPFSPAAFDTRAARNNDAISWR